MRTADPPGVRMALTDRVSHGGQRQAARLRAGRHAPVRPAQPLDSRARADEKPELPPRDPIRAATARSTSRVKRGSVPRGNREAAHHRKVETCLRDVRDGVRKRSGEAIQLRMPDRETDLPFASPNGAPGRACNHSRMRASSSSPDAPTCSRRNFASMIDSPTSYISIASRNRADAASNFESVMETFYNEFHASIWESKGSD